MNFHSVIGDDNVLNADFCGIKAGDHRACQCNFLLFAFFGNRGDGGNFGQHTFSVLNVDRRGVSCDVKFGHWVLYCLVNTESARSDCKGSEQTKEGKTNAFSTLCTEILFIVDVFLQIC